MKEPRPPARTENHEVCPNEHDDLLSSITPLSFHALCRGKNGQRKQENISPGRKYYFIIGFIMQSACLKAMLKTKL